MPVRSYNSKADFDRDYQAWYPTDGIRFGERIELNYDRAFGLAIARATVEDYLAALPLLPDDSILIVGCGYGWSVEVLEERGFPRVLGIDVSTHIQSTKDQDEESLIDGKIAALGLDPASGRGAKLKAKVWTPGVRTRASRGVPAEDLQTGGSRGRVKQALGLQGSQRITWGISELVLETLTDAECLDLSAAGHAVCENVVHYMAPEGRAVEDSDWNLKSLAEWKALLPSDTFLEAGTRRVL